MEWGKENPAPLTAPQLSAFSVSKNPNVIKMEVVYGLLTAPRRSACVWGLLCFSDRFTADTLTGIQKMAYRKLQ